MSCKEGVPNIDSQDHHRNRLCRHDEAVPAGCLRNLLRSVIVPLYDQYESVLTVCKRLAKFASSMASDPALNLERGSDTGFARQSKPLGPCTAYDFMGCLETEVYEVFISAIGSQEGLCIHCCQTDEEVGDRWYDKAKRSGNTLRYSESMKLLFGEELPEQLILAAEKWSVDNIC